MPLKDSKRRCIVVCNLRIGFLRLFGNICRALLSLGIRKRFA